MATRSASAPQIPTSFELKSTQLSMVSLLLKTSALDEVAQELLQQFGPKSEAPNFFEQDAVVLDFSALEPTQTVDWEKIPLLQTHMRACHLLLGAARGVPEDQRGQLARWGLADAAQEPVRAKSKAEPAAAPAALANTAQATLVIDKPLRSGQKVYARGGDLVVLAMVNPGAELIADGNIHVYAPLRGKAMAGARGNTQARIFSLCFEPELVSIAGIYRTSENVFSPTVQSKPAQVRLSNDGQDKLLIEPLTS